MMKTWFVAAAAAVGGKLVEAGPHGCDPTLLGAVVCNVSAPPLERAQALVGLLTPEEKFEQVNTFSFDTEYFNGYSPKIDRLGIPAFNYHTECLHGLRTAEGSCNITTTLFPQVTSLLRHHRLFLLLLL